METFFVDIAFKIEPDYNLIAEKINSLKETKIAICYSNQFRHIADKISKLVNKKIVSKTQILGCSRPIFPKDTEMILVIGQGKFHCVSLAYETKIPTYILEGSKIKKIEQEEIDKLEKKEKGARLKYLTSEKIGILISTKPGQMRLKKAIEFKKSLEQKKGYLFIDNSLDVNQFENFDIDFWVNTACPRMDLTQGNLINLEKLNFG